MLTTNKCVQVHRPAAGKRKAAEAAVPEGVPAHDLANAESPGSALELTAIDNSPEAASTGPMTKAKKRKGVSQPVTPPILAMTALCPCIHALTCLLVRIRLGWLRTTEFTAILFWLKSGPGSAVSFFDAAREEGTR